MNYYLTFGTIAKHRASFDLCVCVWVCVSCFPTLPKDFGDTLVSNCLPGRRSGKRPFDVLFAEGSENILALMEPLSTILPSHDGSTLGVPVDHFGHLCLLLLGVEVKPHNRPVVAERSGTEVPANRLILANNQHNKQTTPGRAIQSSELFSSALLSADYKFIL